MAQFGTLVPYLLSRCAELFAASQRSLNGSVRHSRALFIIPLRGAFRCFATEPQWLSSALSCLTPTLSFVAQSSIRYVRIDESDE
jgi:hypothetical protein